MPTVLVGAAASGGGPATAGLIGFGGEVTAAGVLTAGAVGARAYTQHQQGKASQKMSEYNARLAEAKGKQEKELATEEERRFRAKGEREKARLRVLFGKAGVDMTGTPLLMMEDAAGEIERDAQTIRQGGQIRAWDWRQQSKADRFRGRIARRAGAWNAGATLATGAARAYTYKG